MDKEFDIVIIGGGPAGLAAAVSAYDEGEKNIVIIERSEQLGGILNQCIHNGFGLHTFKEELTGPEYAARFEDEVKKRNIECLLNTMVLDISSDKIVTAINKDDGMFSIKAKTVVLCMGCRERPRGALNIPGARPAGVYSAGTAQKLINISGMKIGKEIVILGSGDIGLIMARRLTLEGAKVKAVVELMPYSGGLKRNIVQCLDDYSIPLLLSHTITKINGKHRIKSVIVSEVDENRRPIKGTETEYKCDTLLLSVGLLPENELSKKAGVNINNVTGGPVVTQDFETNIEGVFACGNVLHVHDLVDFVSEEASDAGKNAALYVKNSDKKKGKTVIVKAENGVRYVVPNTIDTNFEEDIKLRFRVDNIYKNVYIKVTMGDKELIKRKKMIVAPGEMETLVLKKEMLSDSDNIDNIIVSLER
ncbi:MAG: FAD-dependent oxidoreductase [Oscillospiraceae bacterium]|nr:FAD-dependent oxidoreductase [Candidatus Ruminococcus equi]